MPKRKKRDDAPLPPYPSARHNEIPTPEPTRKLRLLQWCAAKGHGTVLITEDDKPELYALRKHGTYFTFTKVVVWARGVNVELPHTVVVLGARSKCDCIGHTTHGKCRHASAVTKLTAEGKV